MVAISAPFITTFPVVLPYVASAASATAASTATTAPTHWRSIPFTSTVETSPVIPSDIDHYSCLLFVHDRCSPWRGPVLVLLLSRKNDLHYAILQALVA